MNRVQKTRLKIFKRLVKISKNPTYFKMMAIDIQSDENNFKQALQILKM